MYKDAKRAQIAKNAAKVIVETTKIERWARVLFKKKSLLWMMMNSNQLIQISTLYKPIHCLSPQGHHEGSQRSSCIYDKGLSLLFHP